MRINGYIPNKKFHFFLNIVDRKASMCVEIVNYRFHEFSDSDMNEFIGR